jgi:hypothetical protein
VESTVWFCVKKRGSNFAKDARSIFRKDLDLDVMLVLGLLASIKASLAIWSRDRHQHTLPIGRCSFSVSLLQPPTVLSVSGLPCSFRCRVKRFDKHRIYLIGWFQKRHALQLRAEELGCAGLQISPRRRSTAFAIAMRRTFVSPHAQK